MITPVEIKELERKLPSDEVESIFQFTNRNRNEKPFEEQYSALLKLNISFVEKAKERNRKYADS